MTCGSYPPENGTIAKGNPFLQPTCFKEQTCKLLVVGGEQLGDKHCHVSPTALPEEGTQAS